MTRLRVGVVTIALTMGFGSSLPAQALRPASGVRPLRVEVSVRERATAPAPRPVAPLRADGRPRREPLVGGLLGVIPGLGHLYAGEKRRGLVVFAIWMGSGMLAFSTDADGLSEASAIVLLGTQVFGIADGALAAERFNRRHAAPSPRDST